MWQNFFVLENGNFRNNREYKAYGETHYMASSIVELDLKKKKSQIFPKYKDSFKMKSAML